MARLIGGAKGQVLPFRGAVHGRDVSDFHLLRAVSRGSNIALRDLFLRYGDRVYRVLRSDRGFEPRAAARGVRDTFLQVGRSTGHFDMGCSVAGWIVRTALQITFQPLRETPGADGSRQRAAEQTPVVVTPLEEVIAALPGAQRLALVLLERETMGELEIADALGIRVWSVWRHISNARRQLGGVALRYSLPTGLTRIGRSVMRGRPCPALWKLNRAASTELTSRIGWHLSACPDCAREYAVLLGLSARLTNLPRYELSVAQRDDVAVGLLAAPLESRPL